jgi:hypothetical protein
MPVSFSFVVEYPSNPAEEGGDLDFDSTTANNNPIPANRTLTLYFRIRG